jgi:hypothetical protein
VAQAALPSKIQSMDTDWYNLMLDLHTEVLHGMNRPKDFTGKVN